MTQDYDPFASLPVNPRLAKKRGPFDDVTGGSSSSNDDPFASLPVSAKNKSRLKFLAPVGQGVTLGLSDEILGAINGLNEKFFGKGTFKQGYDEGRAKVLEGGKEFADEHPIVSPALEIGSSLLAPGMGAAKFVGKAGSTAAKVGRSALAGTALGAGSGAAYSDEGNRVAGGVTGGILGGTLGGLIPAVGGAAGKVRDVLGLRSAAGAEKRAVEKIAEALQRDEVSPEMIRGAEADAFRERLLNAAKRGPDRRPIAAPKPEMLVDIGGANILGLARAAQAVPSKAKNRLARTLYDRQEGQLGRLMGDVEETVGLRGRNVHDVADEIIRTREAAAAPAYAKAHAHGVVDDPEIAGSAALLEELLPSARAAALRLAKAQGIPESRLFHTVTPEMPPPRITTAQSPHPDLRDAINTFHTRIGVAAKRSEGTIEQRMAREALERHGVEGIAADIRGAPRPEPQVPPTHESPTVLYLDYLKQGVDDVLKHSPPEGIGARQMAAIRDIKNGMLDRLDKVVPEYGAARAEFKGHSDLADALELGRNFLKEDHRATSRTLARMSEGEQEMFRIGALDNIRQSMERTGDNLDKVRKIFGNETARNRLRELLGNPQRFDDLERRMKIEGRFVRTKEGVLGNSVTARAQAEIADMADSAINALFSVATGNPAGAIKGGLKSALAGRAKVGSGKIAEKIAEKLQLRPGTPEFDDFIRQISGKYSAMRRIGSGK